MERRSSPAVQKRQGRNLLLIAARPLTFTTLHSMRSDTALLSVYKGMISVSAVHTLEDRYRRSHEFPFVLLFSKTIEVSLRQGLRTMYEEIDNILL